ncbi:hypothetical protein [Flavobacterium terrisoli]|uniref:hypothetical protein n=1 Tax=Flavobacterium terrisoli TaxID=3242195 RepID=UPI0025427F1C|nr:hypothetical protein [Flavobacterium buctense]
MKKFIAALTLLLAFSINANAQDKKELTSTEKGKQEAVALAQYLDLNETMTADFARLFEQKHRTLADKTLSQERRAEVSRVIEAKVAATLTDAQLTKLKQNKDLYKSLITNE